MSTFDRELDDSWRRAPGIFVVCEVEGAAGRRIHALQRRFDPKLAAYLPPHLTLVGSSGAGPIVADTPVEELRAYLAPIVASTPPLTLTFSPPMRFMQTDIVVLPLDPHGPLRELHERVTGSGLRFQRARFAFTPHVTLSFYRTLSPADRQELLAVRVAEPFVVNHLRCSLTDEPLPPRTLLTLPLAGPPLRAGADPQSGGAPVA
jgi:2'-5' RNA ligase